MIHKRKKWLVELHQNSDLKFRLEKTTSKGGKNKLQNMEKYLLIPIQQRTSNQNIYRAFKTKQYENNPKWPQGLDMSSKRL